MNPILTCLMMILGLSARAAEPNVIVINCGFGAKHVHPLCGLNASISTGENSSGIGSSSQPTACFTSSWPASAEMK